MNGDVVLDADKGEIRLFGKRHVAIDAQSLCEFLDSLVGTQVGEVIMHSLEYHLGRTEAERFKEKNPQATLNDLIERFVGADRLSGVGLTKVTMSSNPQHLVLIEIANPGTKGSTGAAKSFIFSWWAGLLSLHLGKELDVNEVWYDEQGNIARGRLVERQ